MGFYKKENRWKSYKKILEKYANFCNSELLLKKYSEVNEYLKKRKVGEKEINFFMDS